jgi:hypothetical protein
MINLGGSGWSLFKDRSVAVYNPRLVSLVLGNQPITEFAPDQMVSISYSSDNINVVKGIDGNTALQRQTNKDAIVTFTLLQMSQNNKWLLDIQRNMQDPRKPIELPQLVFTDYNLMVSWKSTSSFIQKHPDQSYTNMAGATTWSVYCIDMQPNQNIKLDNSLLTNEQILFRKVGEAVKSVGKQITSIFS